MKRHDFLKLLLFSLPLLGPLPGIAAAADTSPATPTPASLQTDTFDSEEEPGLPEDQVATPTPSGPMAEGMAIPATLTPQATPKVKTLQVLKFKDNNGIWDVAIAYQMGQPTPTPVSTPDSYSLKDFFGFHYEPQVEFKETAEWLEKALYSKSGLDPDTIQQKAAQGDSDAQVVLGWAYLTGCWGQTDMAKAEDLFEKAKDSENVFGKALLGLCCAQGYGVQRNPLRGLLLVQEAAKAGNALGEIFLARFDSGYFVDENGKTYLDKGMTAQLYQNAADLGNPLAQTYLGDCYLIGYGEAKDKHKAFEWYQKAADQGNGMGEQNVGWMYFDGSAPPMDEAKAYQWFLLAAEKGEYYDLEMVGKACLTGYQVPKDVNKGLRMLEDAADQGNETAAFDLGVVYTVGFNQNEIAPDNGKAERYFEQYASKNTPAAEAWLGWMFEKGAQISMVGRQEINFKKDLTQAVYWYQKGVKDGSPIAMLQLGKLYFNGLGGLPKDEGKTKEYFAQYAGACGEAGECFLGDTYEKNWGVDQDYDLALQWFRKAAEEGYANAQFGLAIMYYRGRGVPVDKAQAAEWFRKSAEQGGDRAQNEIGYLYRHGWGVPQDYAQAMEWFKKSAAQGNVHAMDNIGWMNEKGMGMPVNLKDALKWYQMGADKGYLKCMNNLKRLQREMKGEKDGLRPNKI